MFRHTATLEVLLCIKISATQVICNYQGLNNETLSETFTINGSFIQNETFPEIKGNYNINDETITWHEGDIFYSIWTRPRKNY